jgi:hypothetical protein
VIQRIAPSGVGSRAAAFSEEYAGLAQPSNFNRSRVLLGAVIGFADRDVDVQIWDDALALRFHFTSITL